MRRTTRFNCQWIEARKERLHTTKRLGESGGAGGSTSTSVTEPKKSRIVEADVAAFCEACISWTLGNNSEIMSSTVSRGNLVFLSVKRPSTRITCIHTLAATKRPILELGQSRFCLSLLQLFAPDFQLDLTKMMNGVPSSFLSLLPKQFEYLHWWGCFQKWAKLSIPL